MVLAAVIGLVWLGLQIVELASGAGKSPTSSQAPAGVKDAPPPPAGEGPAQVTADPPGELPTAVPVGLVTVADACDPENIRIQPFVPSEQRAGSEVELEFLVSTVDGSACTFTPIAKELLLVIEANKQAVYDSTVCRDSILDRPVVVARGFATLVRATWNGRGSGPACSPREGWAPGGKYRLRVGTLGGEPGTVKFNLGAAPKPKPKPKKTEEPKEVDSDETGEAETKPTPKPTKSPKPKKTPKNND